MIPKKRSIYLALSKKLREKNMSSLVFGPQAIGRKTLLLMHVILWEHIMLLSGGQSLFLVHLSIFCTENTENSHLMSNISWNIYLIATLNHFIKLKLYSQFVSSMLCFNKIHILKKINGNIDRRAQSSVPGCHWKNRAKLKFNWNKCSPESYLSIQAKGTVAVSFESYFIGSRKRNSRRSFSIFFFPSDLH